MGEGEQPQRTDLVHIHPFEGGLEQFEVVKVLVLQLGLKLDLFKTDAAREQKIHELAVGSSYRGRKADVRGANPRQQVKERRKCSNRMWDLSGPVISKVYPLKKHPKRVNLRSNLNKHAILIMRTCVCVCVCKIRWAE